MSDQPQGTQTWIDATATSFDQAWRAFVRQGCTGQRPRIEDFWMGVTEPRRPQLLAELLRVEVEYRRKAGEKPAAGEYEQQFPENGALIHDLFGEMSTIQSQPALMDAEQGQGRDRRQMVEDRSCLGGYPEQSPDETELIDRFPRESANAEVKTFRQFVGQYELLEEIGRGAEGIVYRACEKSVAPREVAVKLLLAGAVNSRDAAARFVEEVRRMAQLDHPHIVPYLVSGNDRGQLYYVMRYMRGRSLYHFLKERREPVDPVDAARLMIQIAAAVSYLHAQQPSIVHRDLKSYNILLDEAGKLYVADFGLAVLLDGRAGSVEGGACGTIPYIAPEQFDSRFGEVGPSSDIYSLGVILYELITGQPPFPRTPESILRTVDTDPLPPSRLRAGIPDGLERICLKCLRKATRDRYDSTAVLMAELNRFVQDEPLVETPSHTAWQLGRDWARSEPALAARLAVIVACSVILWGYRLIVGRYAPLPLDHWARRPEVAAILGAIGPIAAVLVWMNQVLLAAWGLASWAFQRQLTRNKQGGLQLGWRVVDVTTLSLLILLDDALMSPLPVAFAVLIVASAFWARADQILRTTLLSMAGYTLLAFLYRSSHPSLDRPYRHFHYLVGLALLGLMLTYQANRTRALARICGAKDQV
jgi:serine/threonine-protein kinase